MNDDMNGPKRRMDPVPASEYWERVDALENEIDALLGQIIAIRDAAIAYGVNDQVGEAIAHAELVTGTREMANDA